MNLQIGSSYWNGIDVEYEFVQYLDYLNHRQSVSHWDAPFAGQKNMRHEEFKSPICISINDEVVHSRPTERKFCIGDVVTIDAGLSFEGWHADMARTVIFGCGADMDKADERYAELVRSCKSALYASYNHCKPGTMLVDISKSIYSVAKEHKLGVIVDYLGHGIGQELHESPRICNMPGLYPQYDRIVLRPGMVICLEPMFTLGSGLTTVSPDGWRVWTQDGSIAAHFESQILITEDDCEVLTKLSGEYPQEESRCT